MLVLYTFPDAEILKAHRSLILLAGSKVQSKLSLRPTIHCRQSPVGERINPRSVNIEIKLPAISPDTDPVDCTRPGVNQITAFPTGTSSALRPVDNGPDHASRSRPTCGLDVVFAAAIDPKHVAKVPGGLIAAIDNAGAVTAYAFIAVENYDISIKIIH